MTRIWLIAALVLALLAAVRLYGSSQFKAGAESVRAELREASDAAAEQARLLSRERASFAERTDAHVLAQKRAAAAVVAAAHVDGNGLRLALADRGQPAAGADAGQCRAERARAELLAQLLDEGSRLVEEGAGIAGDAVALIDGLQERNKAP